MHIFDCSFFNLKNWLMWSKSVIETQSSKHYPETHTHTHRNSAKSQSHITKPSAKARTQIHTESFKNHQTKIPSLQINNSLNKLKNI